MKETPRRTKQCTGKLPLFGAEKKWNCAASRHPVRWAGGVLGVSAACWLLRSGEQVSAVSSYFPNAIDPAETFTAFLLSVVAGARHFAHRSLLRAGALHAVLGISGFPVDDTIRNVFKRFGQGQCQRFFSGLWSWQRERLPGCSAGYSLDLDSTVFERCGRQQGALRGSATEKQ